MIQLFFKWFPSFAVSKNICFCSFILFYSLLHSYMRYSNSNQWCHCSFSSRSWSLSFTWCQQFSNYSCSRLWRSNSIENSHANIENLFFPIARSLPQPSWLSVCYTASSNASCYCPNFYPSKTLTLIGICIWFMTSRCSFFVWISGYAFRFIFKSLAVVKYSELPWIYNYLFINKHVPVFHCQVLKPYTREKLRIEGKMYRKILSECLETLPLYLGGKCLCRICSDISTTDMQQPHTNEIMKRELRANVCEDGNLRSPSPTYETELELNHNCDQLLRTAIVSVLMFWILIVFIAGLFDPVSSPFSSSWGKTIGAGKLSFPSLAICLSSILFKVAYACMLYVFHGRDVLSYSS